MPAEAAVVLCRIWPDLNQHQKLTDPRSMIEEKKDYGTES